MLNCIRHICISKTVGNYFQTDKSTARGCWLICLLACETRCSHFLPLQRGTTSLTAGLSVTSSTRLIICINWQNAFFPPLFFCSVPERTTGTPAFRWSKAPLLCLRSIFIFLLALFSSYASIISFHSDAHLNVEPPSSRKLLSPPSRLQSQQDCQSSNPQ